MLGLSQKGQHASPLTAQSGHLNTQCIMPTDIFIPTYIGYIETAEDAMIIFAAVKYGKLPLIARRPYDFEKRQCLVSGVIIVFDCARAGIKRWTDASTWTPSRQFDVAFVSCLPVELQLYIDAKSSALSRTTCRRTAQL